MNTQASRSLGALAASATVDRPEVTQVVERATLEPRAFSSELAAPIRGHELFELRSANTIARLEAVFAKLAPTATLHLLDGQALEARFAGAPDGLSVAVAGAIESGIHQLRCVVHNVAFVAHVELERAEAGVLQRMLHTRWFTFDRRHISRLSVAEAKVDMLWFDPIGRALEPMHAKVVDLTPDGLSVLAPTLPVDGLFPAAVCLEDEIIQCSARARRSQSTKDGLVQYGLSLETEPDDSRLKEAYIARRFPRLAARSRVPTPVLWELFERSGYLDLRSGEGVSDEWRSFGAKSGLSRDVVYEAKDGTLIGHISITRAYSRSWLMHQFATISKHAESVACRTTIYDFLSSFPVLMDGERAHVVAYFDLHKRWHQLFFHQFVEWVDAPKDTAIAVFDRFERRADSPPSELLSSATSDIQRAQQTDLIAVASLVRSQLPSVVADALDVYPWSLRSENLLRRQDAENHPRTRDVLVLREGGSVRAAALCETGSRKASIFNILNMAQIFVQAGAHAPSREGQLALLSAVRAYYADRGVSDPVIVAPKDSFDGLADPDTTLAETMGVIAMNAHALRQWENFCRFHFGVQAQRNDSAA